MFLNPFLKKKTKVLLLIPSQFINSKRISCYKKSDKNTVSVKKKVFSLSSNSAEVDGQSKIS